MKTTLSILSLLLCFNASADTFYVTPVKGDAILDSDKTAVQELIRSSIPKGKHSAVDNSKQADWVLNGNLLKLGDSYILTLEKKSNKGKPSFSEKMKSTTMSNMDTVAQRLTTAVIDERTLEQTADVTNITENEKTQHTNRIEVTRQWILGIGPSWTSNLNSEGTGGFTLLIGYEWGLDPDFSIDLSYIGSAGRGGDESNFSDFSLGGTYYFSRTKFSPFVTARMGYGSSDINDGCSIFCSSVNESSGWSGSVAAGYKFFRTSSVNVSSYLRYSYIFDKGQLGNASMTSWMIAVHF